MNLKMKPAHVKAMKEKCQKSIGGKRLSGGEKDKKKHKHDDSSSSSDDDDAFNTLKLHKMLTKQTPISYFWYDPLIYRFDSLYIPTFVSTLSPYVEIATINYYP